MYLIFVVINLVVAKEACCVQDIDIRFDLTPMRRVRLSFGRQFLAYLNIVQRLLNLFYVYVIDHGEQSELGLESKKSRNVCLSSYL